MTPQRCENCGLEFNKNIKKYDNSILGYQFHLCKFCLNMILEEKLRDKRNE